MNVLVSIIVPVYNVEKYLKRCINSILNQTYKNTEIILVDDGSLDSCGDICDEYALLDQRIRVIHKENGGLSDARNSGIKAANGEYLLFVDSDDYINKFLVEKVLDAADKYNVDMVLFDYQSVNEKGNILSIFNEKLPKGEVLSLNKNPGLLTISTSVCNKLFRTKLIKESNIIFPVGRWYEDLSTVPKWILLSSGAVYLDSIPLYYYFIREGSIMRNNNYKKNFNDRTIALDEIVDFFKDNNVYMKFRSELEYLVLLNGFYFPLREIILSDYKSEYLNKFYSYAISRFPNMKYNQYIKSMSCKDRLLLVLLLHRFNFAVNLLSKCKQRINKFLYKCFKHN